MAIELPRPLYSNGNNSPTKSDDIGEIPVRKSIKQKIQRQIQNVCNLGDLTYWKCNRENQHTQQWNPIGVCGCRCIQTETIRNQFVRLFIVNVWTETGQCQRHEHTAKNQQRYSANRIDEQTRQHCRQQLHETDCNRTTMWIESGECLPKNVDRIEAERICACGNQNKQKHHQSRFDLIGFVMVMSLQQIWQCTLYTIFV